MNSNCIRFSECSSCQNHAIIRNASPNSFAFLIWKNCRFMGAKCLVWALLSKKSSKPYPPSIRSYLIFKHWINPMHMNKSIDFGKLIGEFALSFFKREHHRSARQSPFYYSVRSLNKVFKNSLLSSAHFILHVKAHAEWVQIGRNLSYRGCMMRVQRNLLFSWDVYSFKVLKRNSLIDIGSII